jgi:regulator of sirC expression with transglutaminase-like and TPR domain
VHQCTIALELDEYDKSPLFLRAFIYQNTGELELALNDLEQYLVFIPDAPDRARIEGQIESIKTKIEK